MTAKLPFSPGSGVYLKDDFINNGVVTTELVSELGWEITAITGANTLSYVAGPYGILRSTTDGTTAHGSALHSEADKVTFVPTGWVNARVRFPDITGNTLTGNNFRIGVDDSVTATDPAVGIFVKSLAGVLEIQAESTNGDTRATVSGVDTSILTSGTTMILGTWYDLSLRWSGVNANGGPDTVQLWVNGVLGAQIDNCVIGTAETAELKWVHWDSGAGATLELDTDYYEFFQAR